MKKLLTILLAAVMASPAFSGNVEAVYGNRQDRIISELQTSVTRLAEGGTLTNGLTVSGTVTLNNGVVTSDDLTLEDGTSKIKSGQTNGTTLVGIELVPKASATTGNPSRLVRVGDLSVGDYFGFNASTNYRSILFTAIGGRRLPAGPNFDTTGDAIAHIGYNNNATNDAAYVAKALYVKAKNSSNGTVGSIYGGDIEMQQDGTETTSVILRLRDSGSNSSDYKLDMYDSKTSGTADIRFPNGAIIKNGDANTLTITEATVAITGAETVSTTLGVTGAATFSSNIVAKVGSSSYTLWDAANGNSAIQGTLTVASTVAGSGFKIGAVSGFSGVVTNLNGAVTNMMYFSGGLCTNVVVTGP